MLLEGVASAAVGFAAENILATIVGNAGEQVFRQARQAVGDACQNVACQSVVWASVSLIQLGTDRAKYGLHNMAKGDTRSLYIPFF